MSWYHALQVRIERSMRSGDPLLANHTWFKSMKATGYLSPSHTHPEHVIERTHPDQVIVLRGITSCHSEDALS